MATIIATGDTKIATRKERCARCRRTIQVGEKYRTCQVHYMPPRCDYRFGEVHLNCDEVIRRQGR